MPRKLARPSKPSPNAGTGVIFLSEKMPRISDRRSAQRVVPIRIASMSWRVVASKRGTAANDWSKASLNCSARPADGIRSLMVDRRNRATPFRTARLAPGG